MSKAKQDADILKELMELTEDPPKSPPPEDEDIPDLTATFDFEGFQVVRREFFAHTREPSAVFTNCKFYVNSACLRRFPDSPAVQVLINRDTKIMALLPCPESAKDSFSWCNERRKPRMVTCRLFFAKIMDLMEWNPDYRYKILGKQIRAGDENLIVFDLTAAEMYRRTISDTGKPKTSRTPVFPAQWQNQFGLPYSEHRQSMQINIFDGYAVYSLKDITDPPKESPDVPLPEEIPALKEAPDD